MNLNLIKNLVIYDKIITHYFSIPHEEMQRRQNPMCYVFPRIVSCDYHRFGTGGEQENLNSICILALNIINDKVFLGKTFFNI